MKGFVMKPSEVLRNAARAVEKCGGGTSYGCIAIRYQVLSANPELDWHGAQFHALYRQAMNYYRQFKPRNKWDGDVWFPSNGPRIIGLCMAADIAESEGE